MYLYNIFMYILLHIMFLSFQKKLKIPKLKKNCNVITSKESSITLHRMNSSLEFCKDLIILLFWMHQEVGCKNCFKIWFKKRIHNWNFGIKKILLFKIFYESNHTWCKTNLTYISLCKITHVTYIYICMYLGYHINSKY